MMLRCTTAVLVVALLGLPLTAVADGPVQAPPLDCDPCDDPQPHWKYPLNPSTEFFPNDFEPGPNSSYCTNITRAKVVFDSSDCLCEFSAEVSGTTALCNSKAEVDVVQAIACDRMHGTVTFGAKVYDICSGEIGDTSEDDQSLPWVRQFGTNQPGGPPPDPPVEFALNVSGTLQCREYVLIACVTSCFSETKEVQPGPPIECPCGENPGFLHFRRYGFCYGKCGAGHQNGAGPILTALDYEEGSP